MLILEQKKSEPARPPPVLIRVPGTRYGTPGVGPGTLVLVYQYIRQADAEGEEKTAKNNEADNPLSRPPVGGGRGDVPTHSISQ